MSEQEIEDALEAGARRARQLLAAGLIEGAALRLLGETVVVGAKGLRDRTPFTMTGYRVWCMREPGRSKMSAVIRKIVTVVEETHIEMGKAIAPPTRRAAAIAVIENPFAGHYVEDLAADRDRRGARRAPVEARGRRARHRRRQAQSYGKAAAVGENGELEHAAAILHPKMGAPVRKVLCEGAALIPSSKKRSGPGTTLDIPLGHKDAAFVRSHFDGMEVQINDAPRANEIMVAVAVTD